jgi:hypothetical protein
MIKAAKILACLVFGLTVVLFALMWIAAAQGNYYQYRDVFDASLISIASLFSISGLLVCLRPLMSWSIRHARDEEKHAKNRWYTPKKDSCCYVAVIVGLRNLAFTKQIRQHLTGAKISNEIRQCSDGASDNADRSSIPTHSPHSSKAQG